MGTKSSKAAHGAAGKGNLLKFDPDTLHLVTDTKHKLYDPRVHKPVDEKIVKSILFRGFRGTIVVWKDPTTGHECVVNGRQRVKACREANKILRERGEPEHLVQAVVHSGSVEAAMDVEATGERSMRGKREIRAMIEQRPEWSKALEWVLGEDEPDRKLRAVAS